MRAFAAAGGAVVALACAACGGERATTVEQPTWQDAAGAVLRQLQSDVPAAEVGGTTRASAAHALRNLSDMYALSFAFADLGGCRRMVAGAAAPQSVARELARPCVHLERAASLFTQAVSRSKPSALVRATQEVQRAEPALVAALARVSR